MARIIVEDNNGRRFLDAMSYLRDKPEDRAAIMKVILRALEHAYDHENDTKTVRLGKKKT